MATVFQNSELDLTALLLVKLVCPESAPKRRIFQRCRLIPRATQIVLLAPPSIGKNDCGTRLNF